MNCFVKGRDREFIKQERQLIMINYVEQPNYKDYCTLRLILLHVVTLKLKEEKDSSRNTVLIANYVYLQITKGKG